MHRRREAWWLIAPLAIFMVVWLGFPFLSNLYYSLSDVTFETLSSPTLTGFDNFADAAGSAAFWQSLWFSLRFAVIATTAQIIIALTLAIALRPLLERYRFLLAILILPLMISPALMGIMYKLMLNEFVGVVPQYLALFGLYPNLLGPDWVVTVVIAIEVLQWTPFALLLLLTALQAIPEELLDAAYVDGAKPRDQVRRIVLPLMGPAIAITAFIRFIDSFRVFDHIYVLTGGGPGTLTTSSSIFIYRAFFQQGRLGFAIASSLILMAFSLLLLWATMRYVLKGART